MTGMASQQTERKPTPHSTFPSTLLLPLAMSHLHPGEGGRRRNARLRSQIHAGEEGAGLAFPRSARIRPQIDATEDGAGVASHRRSTQIKSSDGADRLTRRLRRGGSSVSLPDSEDMLLRLPLDLYSLSRASAVCKRWRGILVDPKFLPRFHAHHRKPPLLGFFKLGFEQGLFTPVLPPPNRIPTGRISLGRYSKDKVLDCRHGRVLLYCCEEEELVVCDPINHKHHRVSMPTDLHTDHFKVAVVCAARDQNHVHGACHSSPFQVVFVYMPFIQDYGLIIARVYSSQTDTWGYFNSTEAPDTLFAYTPSTLVGNALYWPSTCQGDDILEFDLHKQKLTVSKGPPGMNMNVFYKFHITEGQDGAIGLVVVSRLKLQMWQRKVDCQGGAIWLLWKTISLHKLLKIRRTVRCDKWFSVAGYDEDTDVIVLDMIGGVYMVQLKSMQVRKITDNFTCTCYSFTSFYPPGTAIAGGTNGAEVLG